MDKRATFMKVSSAQPVGNYTRTAIDDAKDAAEIRLIEAGPYVVRTALPLKGRGVSKLADGTFRLSESAWSALKAKHTWATDF